MLRFRVVSVLFDQIESLCRRVAKFRLDFNSSAGENVAMTERKGSRSVAYHYTFAGERMGQSRGWMRGGGRMPTAWKPALAVLTCLPYLGPTILRIQPALDCHRDGGAHRNQR